MRCHKINVSAQHKQRERDSDIVELRASVELVQLVTRRRRREITTMLSAGRRREPEFSSKRKITTNSTSSSNESSRLDRRQHDKEKKKKQEQKVKEKIPSEMLEQMAEQILEHTKQLGLWDELRMRLLASIESSKEFRKVECDFKREIDSLCAHVDLTLPRAKLRAKLDAKHLSKSARRLKEQVVDAARKQRSEFRQLYNQQAVKFLRQIK